MKTIFTLVLIILVTIAGISSYMLFTKLDYYSSAFLTAVWYLSGCLLIALLGARKLIVR